MLGEFKSNEFVHSIRLELEACIKLSSIAHTPTHFLVLTHEKSFVQLSNYYFLSLQYATETVGGKFLFALSAVLFDALFHKVYFYAGVNCWNWWKRR